MVFDCGGSIFQSFRVFVLMAAEEREREREREREKERERERERDRDLKREREIHRRLGGESECGPNREIVSFRSCVRAGGRADGLRYPG